MPLSTVSAPFHAAIRSAAVGPVNRAGRGAGRPRRAAASAIAARSSSSVAVAEPTACTSKRTACSASRPVFAPPDRATARNRAGSCAITSRPWVPMDPVEPISATARGAPSS